MTTTTSKKQKKVTKVTHYKNSKESWYEVLLEARSYKDNFGNDVYYPAICMTKDYSKTIEAPGQRETERNHVVTMHRSISELNSVNREVIIVKYKNQYTIVDGKHLFCALVDKGLPIEFKLIEVNSLKDAIDIMRKMNSTSKNWTIIQFVKAMSLISKDYSRLMNYYDNTDITMNMLCGLMYNINSFKPMKANDAVKEGTFQMNTSVKDMEYFIKSIKRFYTHVGYKNTQYCTWGLITFMIEKGDEYPKYEEKFLKKVKEISMKNKYMDKPFGERKVYHIFFSECWNEL